MPVSSGRCLSNSVNASSPPAEAPTPTMGGRLTSRSGTGITAAAEAFPAGAVSRFGRGTSGARGERATWSGRPPPVFFVTRNSYLSRRNEPANEKTEHAECHSHRCAISHARTAGIQAQLNCPGNGEQIFDGLADLHELIQTGRLGDELRDSQVFEQGLVPPGPGRTPHAHGNTAEVSGAADLVQDVFAGILGQIQVHQDEVGNCRIRIGPLPADESEGLASAQQVNQFKLEILPMERPFEKEDAISTVRRAAPTVSRRPDLTVTRDAMSAALTTRLQ